MTRSLSLRRTPWDPERNLLEKWVPIEGEAAAISQSVVGRVPWSERYSVLQQIGSAVLQCCGAAVKKKVKAKVEVETI